MLENITFQLFEYFDKMPFIISYIAGVLSFLSPCVLPLVPIYFFYITGISAKELKQKELTDKEKIKIFINSMLFIAGFSFVFILIGVASANLIGNIFTYKWINVLMALVIILFGINVAGFVKFDFLQYEKRLNLQNTGAFLLGFSFAFGWSPCIGPIFGTIIGMASIEPTKAISMMILYTVGFATPFILMAFFTVKSMKIIEKAKRYMEIIQKFCGILLMIVGVYVLCKTFDVF